jgi:hypothetical protein
VNIVSVDQVRAGIKKYVEAEVASKANGVSKFLIYFMMPSVDKEVLSLINQAKELSLTSSLFNESGNVLIDEVYSRALEAAEKSGKIVLDKLNLAMDKSDVEKLYKYILGV